MKLVKHMKDLKPVKHVKLVEDYVVTLGLSMFVRQNYFRCGLEKVLKDCWKKVIRIYYFWIYYSQ